MFDIPDCGSAYAKEGCHTPFAYPAAEHQSDSRYIGARQLTGRVGLSSESSMPCSVVHIAGSCIPPQVLNPIVRRVAIVVARFHAFGARTHKGFEHEAVNAARLPITATQIDLQAHKPFSLVYESGRKNAPYHFTRSSIYEYRNAIQRLDPPHIRDLVQPLIVQNGLPNLTGQIYNGIGHVGLRERLARQGPLEVCASMRPEQYKASGGSRQEDAS
jgi:hypothetical protein